MNDYSTAYQVACAPGPNAAAAVTRGPGGKPVLVVYLDPVNMSIHSEPLLADTRELGAFFRELAHEAAKLAAEIDPDNEAARMSLGIGCATDLPARSGVMCGEPRPA